MRRIAVVTKDDFTLPQYTHQARCLLASCYMATEPRTTNSEKEAREWAEAHLTHNRDHAVAIEELDPEPIRAA